MLPGAKFSFVPRGGLFLSSKVLWIVYYLFLVTFDRNIMRLQLRIFFKDSRLIRVNIDIYTCGETKYFCFSILKK